MRQKQEKKVLRAEGFSKEITNEVIKEKEHIDRIGDLSNVRKTD